MILLCVNLGIPTKALAVAKNATYTSSNVKKGKIKVSSGTYNQITVKSSAKNATLIINDSSISELKIYAENITILADDDSVIDKVSISADNITIAGTGLYSKINYLGDSSPEYKYLPSLYITDSPKISQFIIYADSSIDGDTTSTIDTLTVAKHTSLSLNVPVNTLSFSKKGYISSAYISNTVNWIRMYGTMNYVYLHKKATVNKASITGLGNRLTAMGNVKQVNLLGQYGYLDGVGINSVRTSSDATDNAYVYCMLEPGKKTLVREQKYDKDTEYYGSFESEEIRYEIATILVKEIIEQEKFDKFPTDVEKVKAVHDYIILNTSYEYNYFSDSITTCYPDEAIGPLLHQKAVCDGYTELFNLYMNLLDVPCIYVPGYVYNNTLSHSWNIITLDSERYHIDVTWDDPDRGKSNYIRYDYFLKNDKQMSKDHTWIESIEPCNGKKYLNYIKK